MADDPLTSAQVARLRSLADEAGLDQHPDWATLLRNVPGDATSSHLELVDWLTAPRSSVGPPVARERAGMRWMPTVG